jgi:hypothetical protein
MLGTHPLNGSPLRSSTGFTRSRKTEVCPFAQSEDPFYRKIMEDQWTFPKNTKGEFAFVTLRQDGRDVKGQKIGQ